MVVVVVIWLPNSGSRTKGVSNSFESEKLESSQTNGHDSIYLHFASFSTGALSE